MAYNFDKLVDRKGTSTFKHDFCDYYFGTNDVLPLWVADMDFETPDFIMDAIRQRAEHPILGYTIPPKHLYSVISGWIKRQHSWELDEKWLKFMPGVLPSISTAIKAFSKKGDGILIQPPIYPPFISIPKALSRKVVHNKLKRIGNVYSMDLEDFKKRVENGVSVFILCNPHNPAGIVWKKEELEAIASICFENNVLVISDEIHADLVHPGFEHIPFATVSKKARENSITLMAPSKTFNIAGLGASFCVVPNPKIRKTYYNYLNALHVSHSSMFAYIATIEAFTKGDAWLNELKVYLRRNFDFALNYIQKNIPGVEAFDSKASFLLWMDFTELGINHKELKKLMVKKGKIGMNNGSDFGPGGSGFQRLNVGAPQSVVQEALKRIERAVKSINT